MVVFLITYDVRFSHSTTKFCLATIHEFGVGMVIAVSNINDV